MGELIKIWLWTQLENFHLFPDKKMNIFTDTFSPKVVIYNVPPISKGFFSPLGQRSAKVMAYILAIYFSK